MDPLEAGGGGGRSCESSALPRGETAPRGGWRCFRKRSHRELTNTVPGKSPVQHLPHGTLRCEMRSRWTPLGRVCYQPHPWMDFLNASVVRTEAFVVILVLVRTRGGRVWHLPGFGFWGFLFLLKQIKGGGLNRSILSSPGWFEWQK